MWSGNLDGSWEMDHEFHDDVEFGLNIFETKRRLGDVEDGWRSRQRLRLDDANHQSGSTPRRLPRSDRPTPDLVSESSSRTVTCGLPLAQNETVSRTNIPASSSPPSSTPEHELGTSRLPSDWVDTAVSVRGRVRPRPVCPRRSCGSGGCEF
jgi:hypothetical protein